MLALVLGLVAVAPFLTRPGLPRQTDAELHVYRAAELGHALRAGACYPRWAPNFYYGYGYPIFNYYAPLTYYLANLFDLLPGVDIVGGVKAVFVLGLLVASLGTYLLGRELFGPVAGVVAAASFTFAPYVVFIDPHARGDLAEHFALCLLPLTFYAFQRLMSGVGGRGSLLGSVVTLAALVFSHNLLGLVASGLLLAYWIGEIIRSFGFPKAQRVWGRGWAWGGLAFVLAAAIIAFFWFPALLERGAVKLEVIGPGHFDFHENFLSPGELFAPSRLLDLGATAPRYRHNLGLAQWLLALPALVVLLRLVARRASNQASPTLSHSHILLLYFVLAGLGLIFLMLPISTVVWERVPGLRYLQFPWRLLGPANLMLALCAAGGTTLLPAGRWRNPMSAASLAMILLLALPVLYPPMWAPDFGPTAPRDILQWEQHSLALGTTSTGDFLPVEAALVAMHPEPTLVESYSRPGLVDKVNRATLRGATVEIIEHGPLQDRFVVSTPKKLVLRLYTFYFPGWRAYVDGEEVEIEVAGPEGFITLWVPEGEHEVLVRFEDTPPRTAGWIISMVGLASLVLALTWMPSARVRRSPSTIPHSPFAIRRSPLVWLSGALLLFVILKGAVIDQQDNWMRYTSPPGQAWAAQHEQRTVFSLDGSGQIELLGYDLPRQHVRSGEKFSVVLYWRALTPLDANYQSFVHLARPLWAVWGQEDQINPGGLPTTRWPLDKYVWDEYEIHVLPGTPPGEYVLNAGLYSMAGGYRLQRHDDLGQVAGDSLVFASVEVERPRRQPRLAELGMTDEVLVTFPEGGLTLLGYAQPRDQVVLPGDWRITLFWRADRDCPAARVRDLVLLDAEGHEVWRLSGEPVDGHYPFGVWSSGEIVRDPLLFVPGPPVTQRPGVYHFGVTVSVDGPLLAEETNEPFVPLGSVEFLSVE
ncbi:MAG: hypothetical protein SWK90_16595 [Chloroflexota bacterium]|nr:hypothetical protein [Chloroflexota bacterium]